MEFLQLLGRQRNHDLWVQGTTSAECKTVMTAVAHGQELAGYLFWISGTWWLDLVIWWSYGSGL